MKIENKLTLDDGTVVYQRDGNACAGCSLSCDSPIFCLEDQLLFLGFEYTPRLKPMPDWARTRPLPLLRLHKDELT